MDQKEQSIADIINGTLAAMASLRLQKVEWVDDGEIGENNKNGSGLMKRAEALEAIFTPANNLFNETGEKIITAINFTTIEKDIDYIISDVEKYGWCGAPYFDHVPEFTSFFGNEDPYKKGETDFVDAVSFVTTTLLDYLVCSGIYGNEKEKPDGKRTKRYDKCKDLICDGVKWLVENKADLKEKDGTIAGVFWPIGKPVKKTSTISEIPGLYFTYSSILALTEVLNNLAEIGLVNDDRINKDLIKEIVRDCYKWARKRVRPNPDNDDYLTVQYANFGMAETINESAALVYILLIFESCEPFLGEDEKIEKENVEQIVATLKKLFDEQGAIFTEGGFAHRIMFSKGKSSITINYDDLTIYFLLLESFCWAHDFFKRNSVSVKDIEDLKDKIDYIMKDILKLRDDKKQLWDKTMIEDVYAIYFNQRALEALTYYRQYIGDFVRGGITITQGQLDNAIRTALMNQANNMATAVRDEVWAMLQKVKFSKLPLKEK